MQKRFKKLATVGLLGLIGSVFGCGIFHPVPPEDGYAPLTQAMRGLRMTPILPPREDIRVGDLFVTTTDPRISVGVGRAAATPRWGSIPVHDELVAEYRTRPSWPATPDAFFQISSNGNGREWPEAKEAGDKSIFAADDVTKRLRLVGLGQFSAATITEGDLSAVIPTEAMNLALGHSRRSWKAVTIRPVGGESYGIPLSRAIDLLLDRVSGDDGDHYVLKQPYRDQLSLFHGSTTRIVWLQVISEVVYVRGVEVTVQTTESFDSDETLEASELMLDDESKPDAATPERTQVPSAAGKGQTDEDDTLDPFFGAFVRAKAINDVLIESDNDDVPGGFIRFLNVTDGALSLRRVWKRPVALGVRGLVLRIEARTGSVVGATIMK